MRYKVTCQQCGQQFAVPERLYGKRAQCTKCNAVIDIGRPSEASNVGPSPSTQSSIVTCRECGQRFSVQQSLLGKRVRCTKCHVPMVIPNPSQEPASEQVASEVVPAEVVASDKTTPSESPSPAKSRTRKWSRKKLLLTSCSLAGGLLVLLVSVIFLPKLFRQQEQTERQGQVAQQGQAEQQGQTPPAQDKPGPSIVPTSKHLKLSGGLFNGDRWNAFCNCLKELGFKRIKSYSCDPVVLGRLVHVGSVDVYERESLKVFCHLNPNNSEGLIFAPYTASSREVMLRVAAAIDADVKQALDECFAAKTGSPSGSAKPKEKVNAEVQTSPEFIAIKTSGYMMQGWFARAGYPEVTQALGKVEIAPGQGGNPLVGAFKATMAID